MTATDATRPDVMASVRDLRVDLPDGVEMPPWSLVRRRPRPAAQLDLDATVDRGVLALAGGPEAWRGRRVAVAAGSRGVRDVAAVVAATVRAVRAVGGDPFVVPAMGSHGSSEASGQAQVLADLGIDETTAGAPVVATMDTVDLGATASGARVLLDAAVAGSDGVVVVNRVKPHTDFTADFGSGLAKMVAIGLGNAAGATSVHASGSAALPQVITETVEVVRAAGLLLGGVGIVEDAAGRTAHVEVVAPEGVAGEQERDLMQRAHAVHGHLPVHDLDVLVVDAMGKEISGAGMDSNVLGRFWIPGVEEPAGPRIAVVTVHRLTTASHGNASGIGLADLAPASLMAQVDLRATYLNAITSGTGGLRRARLPIVLPTDRDVLHAAARMCGRRDVAGLRLARVASTLDLDRLLVTAPLLAELADDPEHEVVGEPRRVGFDADGALEDWP